MLPLIISVVLITCLLIYGYLTGWAFFKKIVGYNVPVLEDTPMITLKPNFDGLDWISLDDRLRATIYADGLNNPRVIAFDSLGRMFVSETKAGRVSVLIQTNDGKVINKTILDGLNSPHGLAFFNDKKKDYLYVAESNQVASYIYDPKTITVDKTTFQNIASLPTGGRHFTRTIAFGPNFRTDPIVKGRSLDTLGGDKLYISVGSSCDVCVEDTWKRAAILESDPEGSFTAEFAGGLRNSVFFTFQTITGEIWATEMGRDNLGDNIPPDEINIIKVAGSENKFGARRYGWPFCYGDKVQDKSFKPDKVDRTDIPTDCDQTESPVIKISAHSAPLGLVFIPQNIGWPKEWEGDLLVALHGSWNRSEPVGYKIVRYDLDETGKVLSQEPIDFATGWISQDKKNIYGRPVDLKFGPDHALYVSDDTAGLIYRINPKTFKSK